MNIKQVRIIGISGVVIIAVGGGLLYMSQNRTIDFGLNTHRVRVDNLTPERESEIAQLSNDLGVDLLSINEQSSRGGILFTATDGSGSYGILSVTQRMITIEVPNVEGGSEIEGYSVWMRRGESLELLGQGSLVGNRYIFEGESRNPIEKGDSIIIAQKFESIEGESLPADSEEPEYGNVFAEVTIE